MNPSPPRNVRSATQKTAAAILEYLHTHYREKITLDGLAKHVNISKSEWPLFPETYEAFSV